MLSRSRLPRGIVTNAVSRLQLKATEIEDFLKRKKKRKEKTPVQMWKNYAEEQFDNITYRVKKESGKETMEQYEPSVSVPEEVPIRPFSTSLLPLLRSDLSVDIRDAFLDTINQAMASVSDYIIANDIQIWCKCSRDLS
ncbi:hypothetical protein BCV72DRAFT_315910 [Rhizopus microsporus var. microsporus]|uniref:Uncharacterized protein n=2 Tax=Rhizopus microsporus TaxID=58291 RepID=A0A2G4T5E8_RHIZD|nr:uncharacterized protein RHIMIDRAFT_246795 [Rhizopus microsporus ATCC 52813]ORE03240.1 hypothetical protein BCV72DRAFT_315910 [Rhizopus microsporus var. microsporus]PHZ16232.1 hypothetical protein RHIMIDRAFT_246795 [Rhizopus microsporus ATCC 52813]